VSVETPRPWQPVLEGPLAKSAAESVRAIAARLRETTGSSKASLALGHAGLAVFFGYLPNDLLDADAREVSESYLDLAAEAVASQPMSASLFPGFTGVAWALEHLGARNPGAAADDPSAEIDEALERLLEKSPWTGPYELAGGLVGIGAYALERLPRPRAAQCLAHVVDRLHELAEELPGGVAWRTGARFLTLATPQQCPNGYFDLGVAHGVPGAICILAAAAQAGIAPEKCRRTAGQAVRWLWRQRLGEAAHSLFPPFVASELAARPSRSAWCYGDAGVAAALLTAARASGDRELERRSIEVARAVASRPAERCGVVDAALCHGATGLGHIFNRFFQHTGEPLFADASRNWFSRAMQMRRPGQGIGGYLSAENNADGGLDWVEDASLLTGAAGIGLALLAATTATEPAWDRMLLISMR
jgi:lantibiotic biosynthesis protein